MAVKRARATTNNSPSTSIHLKRRRPNPSVNDENADPATFHDISQCASSNNSCSKAHDLNGPLPRSSNPLERETRDLLFATRYGDKSRTACSSTKASGDIISRCDVGGDENVSQLPTPKTPRHRDAYSKKIPITPRHRIGRVGKLPTPRTPRTPLTASNAPTVYSRARQLFAKSADPGPLIGRDEERNEIKEFLEEGFASRSGRCMYVSGPPGTGKSALVSEICNEMQGTDGIKAAYVNCMSIKTPEEVYAKLTSECMEDDIFLQRDKLAELRSIFVPKKKAGGLTYVVILDEIDHLLVLDLEVLYTLFEWSFHRSSRLIVIGIANALDLTDRFLPRLKARNLKPQLLPFLPYTAPQIASVITAKLQSLLSDAACNQSDFVPFVHPTAIQLCSKKIASQTGDVRKAFDIIRRTIDLVEAETRAAHYTETGSAAPHSSPTRSPLTENPNLASPSSCRISTAGTSFSSLTLWTAPRATAVHVSRVSAAVLSNGTSQRVQTLNLQQKAALCALFSQRKTVDCAMTSILATPTKPFSLAPTIKRLHETYYSLCKRENALHPLTATEFTDVISGLEMLGLVGGESGGRVSTKTVTPRKKLRDEERRIVSFVDEKDLRKCVESVGGGILRSLLLGGHEVNHDAR